VPVDAIRPLEPVSDERAAMKRAYDGANPEPIEAKRTRIVYRAFDPADPQRATSKRPSSPTSWKISWTVTPAF
jgi:hypothetical protein